MDAQPGPVLQQHAWGQPPPHPELPDGAVHVWRADLAALREELTRLLSQDELERAERFPRPQDGRLWARGRGVLRMLLGGYLGRDPRKLTINADAHGKLALEDHLAPAFNLSHSGEIAVFAFTMAGAVGVDVEVARRTRDTVALAARALGPGEAKRLQQLEPGERQQEFLRAWVRHEAAVKCRGTGLGAAAKAEANVWIAELEMGPGAAAALALETTPSELRLWSWPPAGRLVPRLRAGDSR
jgi:4'-phosphopantetheinyl transferase